MTNVGARIREIREEKRLYIREVAERTGLTVNGIARIERGEVSPNVDSVERLASALDVEPGELFPKALAR